MPTKIFVGNLGENVHRVDLLAAFEKYGRVLECDIIKGYAFVHMESAEDAQTAIVNLNNTPLMGKTMNVEESRSKIRQEPGMGGRDTCFKCGDKGHWSRDCPKYPSSSEGGAGPPGRGRRRGGPSLRGRGRGYGPLDDDLYAYERYASYRDAYYRYEDRYDLPPRRSMYDIPYARRPLPERGDYYYDGYPRRSPPPRMRPIYLDPRVRDPYAVPLREYRARDPYGEALRLRDPYDYPPARDPYADPYRGYPPPPPRGFTPPPPQTRAPPNPSQRRFAAETPYRSSAADPVQYKKPVQNGYVQLKRSSDNEIFSNDTVIDQTDSFVMS